MTRGALSEEISAELLAEVCGWRSTPASIQLDEMGRHSGWTSRLVRVALLGQDEGWPRQVVVKVTFDRFDAVSQWDGFGIARREASFYQSYEPAVDTLPARCFGATFDNRTERSILVLEDLGEGRVGDTVRGLDADDARCLVESLSRFHRACQHAAHTIRVEPLNARESAWHRCFQSEIDTHLEAWKALPPAIVAALRQQRDAPLDLRTYLCESSAFLPTVIHGDPRPDNFFVGADKVTAVDWQFSAIGTPVWDLAYLVGAGLSKELQDSLEEELLESQRSVLEGTEGEVTSEVYRREYAMCLWAGFVRMLSLGRLGSIGSPRGRLAALTVADRWLHAVQRHFDAFIAPELRRLH